MIGGEDFCIEQTCVFQSFLDICKITRYNFSVMSDNV